MLIQTDETDWEKKLTNKNLPVFFDIDYLKAITESFNVTVHYFIYQEADEVLFASAVFVKRERVIVPENFTYSPFWLKPGLNERRQLKIQKLFIELLKSKYRNIALKFNINVMDVRAFKWEGFDAEVRYTYLKDTGKPSHPDINRNIKIVKNNFQCSSEEVMEESIHINVDFFRQIGHHVGRRASYKKLLFFWRDSGYLKSYTIRKEEKLISACLLLMDDQLKTAYILALNPADHTEKYAHTILYQNMINWLKDLGYKNIDFCGANMEGIASFKSIFYPELCPYYIVRYSAFRQKLNPFLNLLQRL